MMSLKGSVLNWMLTKQRSRFLSLKRMQALDIARDEQFWDVHLMLLRDGRGVQTLMERYNLWALVKATARLSGALAEVGVYRGGSAKLICEAKGKGELHLFDTFAGMPRVNAETDGGFAPGDFADTTLEDVRVYLRNYPGVHLHQGKFPDSVVGTGTEQMTFRFVHLDVDIYESTLRCLEFFYPRMQPGAIIVSHDYRQLTAPGVKRAYDEFFGTRPETIIPLWDSQCAVTKL